MRFCKSDRVNPAFHRDVTTSLRVTVSRDDVTGRYAVTVTRHLLRREVASSGGRPPELFARTRRKVHYVYSLFRATRVGPESPIDPAQLAGLP
jgi:hypothetical protein